MIEDKCAGGEGIRWLVSDEWLEQAVLCDGRPPSHALEAPEDEWFGRVNFSCDFLQRLGVAYSVRCRTPRIRLRKTIDHKGTWDAVEEPAKKMREVAALLMRASVAATHHTSTALQGYVDDPQFQGTQNERDTTFCSLGLLLWIAQGSVGTRAPVWSGFGAQITLDRRGDQVMAVTVAIKREKSRDLDTKAQLLLRRKLAVRDELREFAGLCSWVDSIVPVVKPFSQMLWAAVAAPPATGET